MFKYKSKYTDKEIPTPNIWKRGGKPTRFGWDPKIVVLHIMAGTLSGTDSWFKNPNSGASAHYGIGKNGEVHQYADEISAPWANGVIRNPKAKLIKKYNSNPNFYTISIEHEGQTGKKWSSAMFNKSAKLTADICKRWNIPIDRSHIIGHYEIDSVNRPNCPGTGLTSRWKEYINKVQEYAYPKPNPKPDPEPQPKPKPKPEPDPKPDPEPDPKPDPKPKPEIEENPIVKKFKGFVISCLEWIEKNITNKN